MVAAFPLAKLGFLLVKQVAKPIANSIARRARNSPIFRNWICIPTAQAFHWYDVRVRMKLLNVGKVTNIPKLNEEKAIDTGAQLLSEMIILSIASSVLLFEYWRSSEKEEAKQEALERDKANLNDKVMNLELQMDTQNAQIRELTRLAHSLRDDVEKRKKKKENEAAAAAVPKDVSFSGVISFPLYQDCADDCQTRPLTSVVELISKRHSYLLEWHI
jgi:hypothetical protein